MLPGVSRGALFSTTTCRFIWWLVLGGCSGAGSPKMPVSCRGNAAWLSRGRFSDQPTNIKTKVHKLRGEYKSHFQGLLKAGAPLSLESLALSCVGCACWLNTSLGFLMRSLVLFPSLLTLFGKTHILILRRLIPRNYPEEIHYLFGAISGAL